MVTSFLGMSAGKFRIGYRAGHVTSHVIDYVIKIRMMEKWSDRSFKLGLKWMIRDITPLS